MSYFFLGRTVHAVSSALTEPPKEGDKFMIYDVSFNPKGCVWDALIVVQLARNEDDNDGEGGDSDKSGTGRGGGCSVCRGKSGSSHSRSAARDVTEPNLENGPDGWDMSQSLSFPIRVTCAKGVDYDGPLPYPVLAADPRLDRLRHNLLPK